MMEVYVIENYQELHPELSGRELTDVLILRCLSEAGFEYTDVKRTEKGKPYVDGTLHISVSHSGVYFTCAIGDQPVGIDVQQAKKAGVERISRRYFSRRETAWVEEAGEKAFFLLWTRKEAYSKYTGNGLADIMKGIEVLDRTDVEFHDYQLEDGVYCSCCIRRG